MNKGAAYPSPDPLALPRKAGQWLALTGYSFVVLGPLAALLVVTLLEVLGGHSDWLELTVPVGRRLVLLGNSLGLAVAVTGIVMVQGFLAAVAIWSRAERAGVLLLWLVLPLMAIPSYIYALTWLDLAGVLTGWARQLGLASIGPFGWAGSLWVEVAALAPMALGFAWLGLRSVDPDLIEAGRIVRNDWIGLIRITLPLSAPALLTGAGLVFLLSLLDYSVPSLLQANVYPMEIFAEYSATHSPGRAFLLALPLVLPAASVTAGLLGPLRAMTVRTAMHRIRWASRPSWPGWFAGLQRVACALVGAEVLLPYAVLVIRAGSIQGLLSSVAQAASEIRYSLLTATLAALMSLPVGIAMARRLLRPGAGTAFLWVGVLAPLAIPGSLVGIGLTYVANRLGLQSEGISLVLPAFAGLARFAPLAVLVLLAQLKRLDPLLFEAGRLFQASAFRRWLQIGIPLLAPGILASAGLVFALTLGELAATLMVAPPGQATLTMRIYNYLHYGASGTVAGLCLVLAACVLMAGAGVAWVAARWSWPVSAPGEGI